MPSLLSRLLWRLTLATFAVVVIVTLILIRQFLDTNDSLRDRNLSGQVSDVARHLSVTPGGQPVLSLPEELNREYAASGGMFVYQVIDADGRVVLSSDAATDALHQHENRSIGATEFFRLNHYVGDQPLLFFGVSLPVQRDKYAFTVQVAQGPTHGDVLADEFLAELWDNAGWIVLVAFLVVFAIIYLTVRSSLAPVTAASQQAQTIGPSTMDTRISVANLPREVSPLVSAVNQALDRIEHAYQLQKEFTANAGHEIRTPIAVLKAHLDVLEDRAVATELGHDVARLDRLVRQLMRLAQADDLQIEIGQRADLNKIALDAAVLLGPVAIAERKSIAVVDLDHPVIVCGHADYLVIALRNLIENAIRSTPAGTTVEVAVGADGSLSVSDAGPGVPAQDRSMIFERFWRGRPDAETGAGLGLSIVRRIIDAHQGTIEVTDVPGGGARFLLRLSLPNQLKS
ncbi:MAG: sensor histidine kinase [Alphaproteobacteria bacterium]